MTPRRRAAALAAVFLVALAVRLSWVRAVPSGPLKGDAAEYFAYAASLRAGSGHAGPHGERASRMPGYPAFVAAVQAAVGDEPRRVLIAQATLGAAAAVVLALGTEALVSTPWGLAAGTTAAISRDFAEPASWALSEVLFAALMAGALCVPAFRALASRRRAVLTGALWGAAFLTRPEVLPVGFGALTLLPWAGLGFSRRDAAVGLAALALAPALWVGRNIAVLGRPVPATTTGATVRYLGLRHPSEILSLTTSPRFEPPAGLDELARDRAYAQAYMSLRTEIGARAAARAYLFNALSVWHPFLPDYDAAFVFLLPLWAAGLWAARRRPEFWAASVLPPALCAVYMVFGGPASRYRFGFSPALLVVAALGGTTLQGRLGPRRAAALLGCWLALNASVAVAGTRVRSALLEVKAAIFAGR